MLEGLVAGLLNRFLGMYVKNFDPGQLKVGIWSGDVKLRDLELRREALDWLKLPINVVEGHLGALVLMIPWSNLRGAPVQVLIEDVFLLAAPREEAEYDQDEEERRQHRLKMEKLDSAELLKARNKEGLSQEEQKKSQSFSASLVTKIVDNLQVTVKNMHVRYEDALSAPGHPFALGVTLDEFSAVSTDGSWTPTFIQDSTQTTHKLARLGALAVYWNTDSELLGPGKESVTPGHELAPHDELVARFKSMIVKGESAQGEQHQFILRPVSGQAKVQLNKTGATHVAKYKASLLFDEIGVVLDDHQYRDGLMMVDLFHYFIRHQENKRYRPKGVTPLQDPGAWLRFAGEAVLSKIHERNRRWSWEYFGERRVNRQRYIWLFKKKQQQPLSSEEQADLSRLEWKLAYEDLRFWRSLARNQLRCENAEALQNKAAHAPQQGWIAWMWGSKPDDKQDEDEARQMTEEQRKKLYEVIEWDEKLALARDVEEPRDSIAFQIDTLLRTGSFTLRQRAHGPTRDLLRLHFDVFGAQGIKRPDSFVIDSSLGGLRVHDGTTPQSLHQEIVRVKDATGGERLTMAELENQQQEAFFRFRLEQNPLDGLGDVAVMAQLKPLEVVWNRHFVEGIAGFFRPPERHMESITALMASAGATVESFREQTRAGLEFALEEHKTINAKLDLQAPLIMVPESVTAQRSTCLILDAGHISVNSELVDKETLQAMQSKQSQTYTDRDFARLESLMYDRFLVQLANTRVLVGPSMAETKQQLTATDDRLQMHLVERTNVDFVVETSILPKAPHLTRVRVSGHLPVLHAGASDTKYQSLMRIVAKSIPMFDDGPSQQRVPKPGRPPLPLWQSSRSGPRRSAVVALPAQPEAIVVSDDDEDDEDDEEDDADDDEDKFEDADDGAAADHLSVQHRRFEFKFTVDELRGSLFRSGAATQTPDQRLVEVVAQNFALQVCLRPFNMVATVTLGSVRVDDFVDNPPAEFKSMVTSGDVEDQAEKRNLVEVKVVKVLSESPEFMAVYEGVETHVDVAVSTINLIVTRKTLLSLLDFALVTFANQQDTVRDRPVHVQAAPRSHAPEPAPTAAMRVKVDLKSIRMILNNDGIRLATLSFNHADVAVFLQGSTMRLSTRIGDLGLVEDGDGGVADESPLRRLVTIQGDELADFRYEAVDAANAVQAGYDSSVFLRAGSVRLNFAEEPWGKIVDFVVKFGKMQAIYNAARDAAANQANQLQQSRSKLKFDVLIRTPILVFLRPPVAGKAKRDVVTAHLGEMYAQNSFDAPTADMGMKLVAGIRNIKLTSHFAYAADVSEELEIVDHVDLGFDMTHAEHKDGSDRPEWVLSGHMTDVNVRLSQYQLRSLLEIARAVPAAFASHADQRADEAARDVDHATLERARTMPGWGGSERPINMSPELGTPTKTWTRIELGFAVRTVGLSLINAPADAPVGQVDQASLSRLSLDDSRLKIRIDSNHSLEAEFVMRSFSVHDARPRDATRFRRIMASPNKATQQLMVSVTVAGGEERSVMVMIAIDSPRIVFALDYVFAMQRYMATATQAHDAEPVEVAEQEAVVTAARAPTRRVALRLHVVDAQLMLIANPLSPTSEAIVLGTKQVLLSRQHALTFQVSECGLFLCRMDRVEDTRLRVIDDFSVQMSAHRSPPGCAHVHVEVDPLVLRVSLCDMVLVMQIVARASELSGPGPDPDPAGPPGPKQRAANTARGAKTRHDGRRPGLASQQVREELTATVDGIRVVVIGDLHELPILDMSINKFTAKAANWRSNLQAEAAVEMYTNVYNFAKSAWEPLVEPWQVGISITRQQDTGLLSVKMASSITFDVTITTATMALASKSLAFLTQNQDVMGKPRGVEAPYRIRNYTGFAVLVEARHHHDEEPTTLRLQDGQEAPWTFEDWAKRRANLLAETTGSNKVAVQLEGSGFAAVENMPLNREGEFLYALRPRTDQVLHKLVVEVRLGTDHVKYVTLRSPLLVENATNLPIELGVYDAQQGNLLKTDKIAPGESRPAPVGAVYFKSLLVRPDGGFGYGWSSETLWWRDLLQRPTRTMVCKGENGDPFYLQLHARFDGASPVSRTYPYMRLKLSAPVTLENLLPHDFKLRIYDRNTRKDWTNFVRKGGVSPVHVVDLSHLLLLSVDLQDTAFKPSDFSVINAGSTADFEPEGQLVCTDGSGLHLRLGLHYYRVPDGGGAFTIAVFSPYVILNKTGLDLSVRHRSAVQTARAAQPLVRRKASPMMFSYPHHDGRNRATLRVADSEWSKPQSLDAVGSTTEVVLDSSTHNAELHLGVTVAAGRGKYKLSKLVTVAPRFVIHNGTGEALSMREPSSSSLTTLAPDALQALHFLHKHTAKQLCLCYPGLNNQWTAPFKIADLGTTHVKIARPGQRQRLVRVDILMEDATVFVKLAMESRNWPFSIRNESDTEFVFYQAPPDGDEDGAADRLGWRPIRYRLPARSIMPYAWDFPAAAHRTICLCAHGQQRRVKLSEMGALMPMKLAGPHGQPKTIDMHVAADGPTQTLILNNDRPATSLSRHLPHAGPGASKDGFAAEEADTSATFCAQLTLSGIGISLINAQLRELAYVTLREVQLRCHDAALCQTASLAIKWIQIDNQLYGGLFPMVLYPSVVPKKPLEIAAHPSLHAMVTRVKDDSYGVEYLKYASVLLQQMTVELDEDFVLAVLDYSKVPGAAWAAKDGADRLCDDDDGDDDDDGIPVPKQVQTGRDLYFELLHIQPMQLDLSFMRTERVNVEDKTSSRNPVMFFFNVMTMALGNINDAPVRFNALVLENARVSVPVLLQSISSHYAQQAMYQVHRILGSADFLGNPVGLFANVSSGFADIFYEPYQGLIMSDRPEDFGLGLARGAGSFVKKSVYGFSDSFSKFTGSLSKGLAAATMDKQFQDRRRITRVRNRPKHALYGVTAGANSFFTSVASGVGGLARRPLEGAEQEGALGFFKGVGKGMLGAVTKPTVGVLDFASHVSEGIRNTTTVFDGSELDRVRLTRHIPADGIVRPYNAREALGQSWLKQVDNGRYFEEDYIGHLELPAEDMVAIVTYARILLVRTRRLTSEWDVPLKDVQTIAKERTGLSLTLRGGTNGPFIPVAEESGRAFLYRLVAVAVDEFNRRFRGLE